MEGNLSQGGFNLGTVLGAVGVSAGLRHPGPAHPRRQQEGKELSMKYSVIPAPQSQKLHGKKSLPS